MTPKQEDELIELIAILCAALIIVVVVFALSLW